MLQRRQDDSRLLKLEVAVTKRIEITTVTATVIIVTRCTVCTHRTDHAAQTAGRYPAAEAGGG